MFPYIFYSLAVLGFIPFIAVANKIKQSFEREKSPKVLPPNTIKAEENPPRFLPVVRPTVVLFEQDEQKIIDMNLAKRAQAVFDLYGKKKRKKSGKRNFNATAEFVKNCLLLAEEND